MVVRPPGGVVIAAPASGNGKTTVATGLMAALRGAGHQVAPFKVGPDFIDPAFHALAAGRPGRNLDANLQGEQRIAPLYVHGSAGADIAVVEGVMGLFDGRIGHRAPDGVSGFGSTAHIAALLGAPVVLVVDARGYSESIAALVRGYSTYAPGVRIVGVICNQVGSPRHTRILTEACAEVGVPVLGAVPRDAHLTVPSRHLGLLTPDAGTSQAAQAVAAMGQVIGEHVDLDALAALASTSVECAPWDPAGAVDGTGLRIGIAHGPAFGFRYIEWDECLAAAGAQTVFFDPCHERLPEELDALILPGGYPEEHAAELEANATLREQIRRSCARGLAVYAECGGYAYLGLRLDGHAMCGVLDIATSFGGRLHLGYRDAVALTDSVVCAAGSRVVGHEFHRTVATAGPNAAAQPGFGWVLHSEGTRVTDGVAGPRLHAGYLHLHPAGNPELVQRLLAAARAHHDERVATGAGGRV